MVDQKRFQFWIVLLSLFGPLNALPAVYTVLTLDDSGPGSLRQAILDANNSPGLDSIQFNIAPGGPQTLFLPPTLPVVTDPLLLDATTQPGYSNAPIVEIRVPPNFMTA